MKVPSWLQTIRATQDVVNPPWLRMIRATQDVVNPPWLRMVRATQDVANSLWLQKVMALREFAKARRKPLGRIDDTAPDDLLDEEVIERLELPDEHRETLIRAERLPLVVLQEVLRDPRHLHRLSPREFELFVAEILERLGFTDVLVTPRSGDEGRDVMATKVVDRIPLFFMFECKKYDPTKPVRIETIRALLGAASVRTANVNKAVLVTTSRFTKGGWSLIASEARLDGRDYDDIVQWITDIRGAPPSALLQPEAVHTRKGPVKKTPSRPRRSKRPD